MWNFKNKLVFGLRGLQIICIGTTVTGFIWGSSDWLLTTVLVQAPVTPLSVLMMLYGTVGTGLIEGIVRRLSKGSRDENLK